MSNKDKEAMLAMLAKRKGKAEELDILDNKQEKEKVILKASKKDSTRDRIDSDTVEIKKDTSSKEPKKRAKKTTEIKPTCQCEICGKDIFSEPRKIDFNMVTGMAEYWRDSRRYIKSCDDCCKELNKVIDNWVLGKNPNLCKFNKEGL